MFEVLAKPFVPAESHAVGLEFWQATPEQKVKSRRVKSFRISRYGKTARELLVEFRRKAPREPWSALVAVYSGGQRQMSRLVAPLPALTPESIRVCFTTSNTYVAPNFNCDTSTNVAGLTALKGSAPEATDKIYVYNGASLTVESALACLLISLGETSAGAAPAEQRVGHLVFNAGVTVTFTGNPTATNSGIKSNPASAATESKSSSLTISGASGSRVTFTNSVGGNNANNAWRIVWTYGLIPVIDYADFKYPYSTCLSFSGWSSTYCAGVVSRTWKSLGFYELGASSSACVSTAGYSVDEGLTLRVEDFFYQALAGTAVMQITGMTGVWSKTRLELSWQWNPNDSNQYFIPYQLRNNASDTTLRYGNMHRVSSVDIRPTQVVPAGLALADPSPTADGELVLTWTNAASYAAGDKVVVYNASGDAVLAILDATLGTGRICGLTNGTAYTVYAKASSDNYIFSAASGNVGPTTCTGTKTPVVFFELDADDNSIPVGGTIDFSAAKCGVEQNDVTGATVTAKIHNASTGAEIATVATATGVDFAAGVARTLADIFGAAPTWTDDQGVGDYELRVTVSDDEITTETSRYGFAVIQTTPGAPAIAAAVASATGATLTLAAAVETDVLYVRYRKRRTADGWSEESESLKRTGSGSLAVELDDVADWEFVAYTTVGGVTSAWSDPAFVVAPTPTEYATVDEALVQVLSEDADFWALCGGRFFADVCPQTRAREGPYATYHHPAGTPTDHLLGASDLAFDVFQINHCARTKAEAAALAEAARLALLGWSGDVTLADGRVLERVKIRLLEAHDEGDFPIAGAGQGVSRAVQDWQVSHRVALPAE